jgi:hypothetical protein
MNIKENFISKFTGDPDGEGGQVIVFGEDIKKQKQFNYIIIVSCVLLWLSIIFFLIILRAQNKDSDFFND